MRIFKINKMPFNIMNKQYRCLNYPNSEQLTYKNFNKKQLRFVVLILAILINKTKLSNYMSKLPRIRLIIICLDFMLKINIFNQF